MTHSPTGVKALRARTAREARLSRVVRAIRGESVRRPRRPAHLRHRLRRHPATGRAFSHAVAQFGAAVLDVDQVHASDDLPGGVQHHVEVADSGVLFGQPRAVHLGEVGEVGVPAVEIDRVKYSRFSRSNASSAAA